MVQAITLSKSVVHLCRSIVGSAKAVQQFVRQSLRLTPLFLVWQFSIALAAHRQEGTIHTIRAVSTTVLRSPNTRLKDCTVFVLGRA